MKAEQDNYQKLIDLSDDKRKTVIQGRIDDLEKITAKEQDIADSLKSLENKRVSLLKDMAIVTGHDNEKVTVTQVIEMLSGQPEQQKQLTEARDALTRTAGIMQTENERTQVLLQQALELVEFDLTLFKSLKQAPETANYNKDAYNTGELLGGGGFDAKQ